MNKNEVDAWWGSHSVRSLLPGIAASLLATSVVWAMVWLVQLNRIGLYILAVLTILVWIGLALRWAYRMFGYNYRLTTRRLFHEKGLLRRRVQQMNLDQVTEVVVKRDPLSRFLNVGQVHVTAHGGAPASVTLNGVFAPDFVAEKILALSRAQ